MFPRFFSFGTLAAIISLLSELILFSFSPEQSLLILALAVPFLEEAIKFGFLLAGRTFLLRGFSPDFFAAAGAFGLGFALPESILSGSSSLVTSPLAISVVVAIHLISAIFLSSAVLFLTKTYSIHDSRPSGMVGGFLSAFALFIFSFAIHALYNFFIFVT